MSIYLGIDIGTSGTKTLAINERGKILGQAMATYPCYHPKPLWSEQDPDDWWQATVKTVRAVVKKAKLKPADVRAIGLSGQMHGSVFLDKTEPRRPPGAVVERPADGRRVRRNREAGRRAQEADRAWSPIRRSPASPRRKSSGSAINEPKNFAKTVKVLLPKDEIRRRLTGEFATEVSDASGMLLLDVVNRRWSKELLDKLELDASLFAHVLRIGRSHRHAHAAKSAKLLGLSTDCMVVGGAGDCAAGAVGNGIVRPGVLSTSIGTSGVVFVHSDTPQVDPRGPAAHVLPRRPRQVAHDGRHARGRRLAAMVPQRAVRNGGRARPSDARSTLYDVLTEEAAVTPPGAEGLFFLPYLAGERTPHADPHRPRRVRRPHAQARARPPGAGDHGRRHLLAARLPGDHRRARRRREADPRLGRRREERVLAADAGRRARQDGRLDGRRRRPGYGVALLAAVGAGEFKNIAEACDATVKTTGQTKPQCSAAQAATTRRFPIYQKLYRSLRDDFRAIAELG